MAEPILGILFDKDGTLFEFEATWNAWAEAMLGELADSYNAEVQSLGSLIGFDSQERRFASDSEVIAGTPEDIVRRLMPGLPDVDSADLLEAINASAACVPLAEAVPLGPLLAELRAMGLRLGVATNDSEVVARMHIAAAEIEEEFEFIAGYDSGFGAKPLPGMCLAFAAAIGLPPANVLMVGDSATDLLAGRAAGMRTVAVLTGRTSTSDLAALATAVLPNIGHLPRWIVGCAD